MAIRTFHTFPSSRPGSPAERLCVGGRERAPEAAALVALLQPRAHVALVEERGLGLPLLQEACNKYMYLLPSTNNLIIYLL